MSEPSDCFVEQGKVNHMSTEGQSHTLNEEDESSINKVLGWVGMLTRHSVKGNERPGVEEEQDREGPEDRGTLDLENASSSLTEIKPKPSPKLRVGLPRLFLRTNTRVETSEKVLDKGDGCQPGDQQDNIIFGRSAQKSASGLNFITEELAANPSLSMMDDGSDNMDDDIRRRECLYRHQGSQNQLANLMSLWESENKGPKGLSFKKSAGVENKASDRKISKLEFYLSPSKASKTFEYTGMCESFKGFSESHNGTRHDDNISVGEKASSFANVQMPQEHKLEIQSTSESLNSPTKQMDDIPIYQLKETFSPMLSPRKSITEQYTNSDLKSCWEREKLSAPHCMPKHSSQQGLNISTSPNRVESPETGSSSLNRDLGGLKASSEGKLEQRSKRILVPSPRDDTDRMSYNRSPFKTRILGSDEGIKFSSVSYPIRNISSVPPDHRDQSTGDTAETLEQSRTLSPRHMPKASSRGSYSIKGSRMVGSPLKAFPIDISPTENTSPLTGLEHTPRGQTRYPHGVSSVEESSPGRDGNLLVEKSEQRLLSLPGNTSERKVQYQLKSSQSPSCFGTSQAPGKIYMDDIQSKQSIQVPVSKNQTHVQLISSPEPHRKTTTTERSVEGIQDVMLIVLTEQMQLEDLKGKPSQTRPFLHLSSQHSLSLTESSHVSGFLDQPDKQEWAGEQVCVTEHTSPSRQFQHESEITFDTSSSTSAEAGSLSRTSSACEL